MDLLKKESMIFIFLFLSLSLIMHFSAWIDHPVGQVKSLENSSLGVWHPFFFTVILYLLIAIIRKTVKLLKRISS